MPRTRKLTLLASVLAILLLAVHGAAAAEMGAELFMRDGQLISHPVRVFVTADISEAMQPRLLLVASHTVTEVTSAEVQPISPKLVARAQRTQQRIHGQLVDLTGTLLCSTSRITRFPSIKA